MGILPAGLQSADRRRETPLLSLARLTLNTSLFHVKQ
jgi:hypothetical protein